MDQDLIAYLEKQFGATSQQISALREETTRQISALREETVQRFEQVDRRFEQVDRRFEQVDRRFEQVETAIRQTRVLIEGTRDDMRLLAEGLIGTGERLIAGQIQTSHRLDNMKSEIEVYFRDVTRRVGALEDHAERETRDVMTLIRERWARTQPPQAL
jgi:chromosome segregation ATPase